MTETRTRTDAGHHERDLYDLPLTTTPEAAALFRDAQERLLKVQIGAAPLLQRAVLADPGFAVGQATLALLGHDFDVSLDTARHLRLARQSALRATDRERSFVDVAASRVRGSHDHLARLLRHLAEHPRDALVLNLAVPTVAFSGRVEVPEQAWALVEAARPSFGSDWWYAGLLAFVRQEQGHFVEAGELALGALAIEPAAGHAAHASCHRPRCRAVRALVDSASLLWRARLDDTWLGAMPIEDVLSVVDEQLLVRPPTLFVAMHAAVALAARGDAIGLRLLGRRAASDARPAYRELVVPLAAAMAALVDQRPDRAAQILLRLMPDVERFGASMAQRERPPGSHASTVRTSCVRGSASGGPRSRGTTPPDSGARASWGAGMRELLGLG